MSATNIEWTDRVWNPVTGCRKVSPGCKNCYAEGVAHRFWATQYPGFASREHPTDGHVMGRPRRFTDVMWHTERLDEPLAWRKPAKVFVNSMSDLFHEDVPDAFIDRVFAVMALAGHHRFQVLTKRPERMRAYASAHDVGLRWLATIYRNHHGAAVDDWAFQESDAVRWSHVGLPNVWLGVSVEDQDRLERADQLKDTPAAVRFLSCEPLLEDLGALVLDGINWVIVGGESGPGARPCQVGWVRDIVRQCQSAGVPVFVKQLGARPVVADHESDWSIGAPDGTFGIRHRKGGDPLEWPVDLRVREFPR